MRQLNRLGKKHQAYLEKSGITFSDSIRDHVTCIMLFSVKKKRDCNNVILHSTGKQT